MLVTHEECQQCQGVQARRVAFAQLRERLARILGEQAASCVQQPDARRWEHATFPWGRPGWDSAEASDWVDGTRTRGWSPTLTTVVRRRPQSIGGRIGGRNQPLEKQKPRKSAAFLQFIGGAEGVFDFSRNSPYISTKLAPFPGVWCNSFRLHRRAARLRLASSWAVQI